eukprot:403351494
MINLGFQGLGFYSIAVLYLVFGICSLFSTGIVKKIGTKTSLVVGSLCYSFWIFSFLSPAFAIHAENKDFFLFRRGFVYFSLVFTAAFIGFGASIIWVAQGRYVSICCPPEKKGFFFSYFWIFFTSSIIVGNITSSVILQHLRESTFYVILVCIGVTGSMTFLLLTDPPESQQQTQLQTQQPQRTFMDDFQDTINLLKSPRMLQVIPLMMQTSISMVAATANFLPMMYITLENEPDMNDQLKFKTCLMALLPLGLGGMLGGSIFGQILDKFKHRFTLYFSITLLLSAYTVLFVQVYLWKFNSLLYILSLIWGFQDSFQNNFVQCVCGFEFDSNLTPFSISKLTQAITTFFLLLISSTLKTQAQFAMYFIFTMIFGLFSLILLLNFNYRGKPQPGKQFAEQKEKLNEMSDLIKHDKKQEKV